MDKWQSERDCGGGKTMLADNQKSLLKFLGDYQAEHGFLPSVRDVMAFLRVRSTNTAQYHLNRLKAEGYLSRERGRARAFQLTDRAREALGSIGRGVQRAADTVARAAGAGIPLLGRVTAGALDAAIEDAQGELNLAEFVHADEATFALRVDGDSMAGAGMFDGDVVIVRRQPHVREGEIGVLLVDGETTIKSVHYEPDAIVLRPANDRYREIRIPRNHPTLETCGRVIGVVRRV